MNEEWIEEHPADDSESCAWCGEFKCCMEERIVVGVEIFCSDQHAEAWVWQ
jgi:hypothetical protein